MGKKILIALLGAVAISTMLFAGTAEAKNHSHKKHTKEVCYVSCCKNKSGKLECKVKCKKIKAK